MFKIIRTDMGLSARTLVFVLIYCLFFPMLLRNNMYVGIGTVSALAVYVAVLGLFAAEERDRVDLLYRIMPVRAADIVGAKYIESVIVWIGAAAVSLAATAALKRFGLSEGPVNYAAGVLASFVTMAAVTGISLPLVYKYGYTKSRVMVMLVWIGLSFAAPMLAGIADYARQGHGIPIVGVIAAAAGAAGLAVSARISLRIYKNRV